MFFRDDKATPAIKESIAEVHELLGLARNEQEFRLLSSPLPGGPGELSVGTRSLSQMLTAMALGVEIPESHAERNLTPLQPLLVDGETSLRCCESKEERIIRTMCKRRSNTRGSGSGSRTTTGIRSGRFPRSCFCSRSRTQELRISFRPSRSLRSEVGSRVRNAEATGWKQFPTASG